MLSDGKGNRLLVVSTNCDTCQKSTTWGGLSMEQGSSTEQVLDIVQIDRAGGKVFLTRIGAGDSRCFAI